MNKKHKAIGHLYKIGIKNIGEEETKKNLKKAFNKPTPAKHTALSQRIEELKERKGEAPLAKLKRLTNYK